MHVKRKQQLVAAAAALRPYSTALIVGDFNFDNAEENATVEEVGLKDTWPLLRPNEPGFTEGQKKNSTVFLSAETLFFLVLTLRP